MSAKEKLNFLRDQKLRKPEEVMKLALPYLQTGSLHSEEDLAILEQLIIAAIDTGNLEVAESGVTKLESRFTDSSRVLRLRGLVYESASNYPAALELYQNLLAKNPSNLFAHKRIYAISKAQGVNVVPSLLSYLKENQGDVQGWYELADQYMALADWQGAAFALEECVLLDPLSSHLHTLLGECYYTLSNSTSPNVSKNFTSEPLILMSRRHFSEALNLKRGSVRALMGLALSSKQSCTSEIPTPAASNVSLVDKIKSGTPQVDEQIVGAKLHEFALAELSKSVKDQKLNKSVQEYMKKSAAEIKIAMENKETKKDV
ncbi:hypothetical protein TrLO_g3153 [Triparma laevis f. longispina]|uniref:ER membrane protein complex subunit 2 n=1 Tax=Triparma laevis f. longispina TaxID=1714387 RepID=A0A9W7C9W5_9STRA|nr:hypothetical protein TrLO_g3153 [Triparma laevis f. longispina]